MGWSLGAEVEPGEVASYIRRHGGDDLGRRGVLKALANKETLRRLAGPDGFREDDLQAMEERFQMAGEQAFTHHGSRGANSNRPRRRKSVVRMRPARSAAMLNMTR